MARPLPTLLLAAVLVGPSTAAAVPADPELDRGISQAREGDFEAAIVTLDGAARRLTGQPGRANDLARTHLYLAVAYFGLNLEMPAKSHLLQALRSDPSVAITAREFPPKIYAFFMAARNEAPSAPAVTATVAASGTNAAPAPQSTQPAPIEGRAPGTFRVNPTDGLEYVWIPPGSFEMGCVPGDVDCSANEKPRHQVTLTKGFWLGRTEVTVAAYKRFVVATRTKMPDAPDYDSNWSKVEHPITEVTSDQALAFCRWAGGRLPTEAEWEYAARGGKEGLKYPWGNEPPVCAKGVPNGARFHGCNDGTTDPVASYGANGFGLFDMAGNVWEWCFDWHDDAYYSKTPPTNPLGPSRGRRRVMRGGSWTGSQPLGERLSSRYLETDSKDDDQGFRCASNASVP